VRPSRRPRCAAGRRATCARLTRCSAAALFRRKRLPAPKSIVITGATAGIGKALALHYAKAGVSLALTGRNKQALDDVARECEARCAAAAAQQAGQRAFG